MAQPFNARVPVVLMGQSKHMSGAALTHHQKMGIKWGYWGWRAAHGAGLGQQSLVFGGLYDGASTAHGELLAEMLDMRREYILTGS